MLATLITGFPGGSEVKASACNVGDVGSIPELGRSPGEGNGNPLQYSYMGKKVWTKKGSWQATVHGIAKRVVTKQDRRWSENRELLFNGYSFYLG